MLGGSVNQYRAVVVWTFVIAMRTMAEVPAWFAHRIIAAVKCYVGIIVVIVVAVIINIAIGIVVIILMLSSGSRSLVLLS